MESVDSLLGQGIDAMAPFMDSPHGDDYGAMGSFDQYIALEDAPMAKHVAYELHPPPLSAPAVLTDGGALTTPQHTPVSAQMQMGAYNAHHAREPQHSPTMNTPYMTPSDQHGDHIPEYEKHPDAHAYYGPDVPAYPTHAPKSAPAPSFAQQQRMNEEQMRQMHARQQQLARQQSKQTAKGRRKRVNRSPPQPLSTIPPVPAVPPVPAMSRPAPGMIPGVPPPHVPSMGPPMGPTGSQNLGPHPSSIPLGIPTGMPTGPPPPGMHASIPFPGVPHPPVGILPRQGGRPGGPVPGHGGPVPMHGPVPTIVPLPEPPTPAMSPNSLPREPARSRRPAKRIREPRLTQRDQKQRALLQHLLAMNQELIKAGSAATHASPAHTACVERLASNIQFVKDAHARIQTSGASGKSPPQLNMPLLGPIGELSNLDEAYHVLEELFHDCPLVDA